jgi:uncharacterized protein (TIGR03435 family)
MHFPFRLVSLLALSVAWVFGQAPLSFDAATVKVNKSGEDRESADLQPGGQTTVRNATLRHLVMSAYKVDYDAVTGGPSWLDSDRFDVIAKAAPGTSQDDRRRMLQTLLAERFKLAVHREPKVMAVYALTVGKDAPALKKSVGESGPRGCREAGVGHVDCRNMTMAALAAWLPHLSMIDLPVVDATNLDGAYDFTLDWTPDRTGNSILDAVQSRLGVKVERRRQTIEAIVIDQVDRVLAN